MAPLHSNKNPDLDKSSILFPWANSLSMEELRPPFHLRRLQRRHWLNVFSSEGMTSKELPLLVEFISLRPKDSESWFCVRYWMKATLNN